MEDVMIFKMYGKLSYRYNLDKFTAHLSRRSESWHGLRQGIIAGRIRATPASAGSDASIVPPLRASLPTG